MGSSKITKKLETISTDLICDRFVLQNSYGIL